jgi:hypothetical protein
MDNVTHRDAHASSAPDNLITNPLDKPKQDDRTPDDEDGVARRPLEKPDAGDNLITNPLDKPGAHDNLIENPLDKE